ncbi:MAG TPA: hypothetical protein VGM64_04775 [Lacunisphaera sp.]|jgi:hypothetical protein
MNPTITVDRQHLRYSDGGHELVLSVEWSAVAKTEDCPIDFEIDAGDLQTWTKPAGEPIDPIQREQVLHQIAAHYSKAPSADIIGKKGALLRGVSKFRFSLQLHPTPSYYYEVGRFLAIPMVPATGEKEWHRKYVADFTGITEWTDPKLPLDENHLRLIADRIIRKERIGVTGLSAA